LNKSLASIGVSPVSKKRLHSPGLCRKKLENVTKKLTLELVGGTSNPEDEEKGNQDSEIILQLKEKFKNTYKNSEKF